MRITLHRALVPLPGVEHSLLERLSQNSRLFGFAPILPLLPLSLGAYAPFKFLVAFIALSLLAGVIFVICEWRDRKRLIRNLYEHLEDEDETEEGEHDDK